MEDISELVEQLEKKAVVFWVESHRVGFALEDWKLIGPSDPAKISEVVLEREEETRVFLERRAAGPTGFGAYAGIFRAAIQNLHTPAGVLVWLRESCPSLYRDLTTRLPDRIQSLWEQGAPLEEFKRAIVGLVEAQGRALNFYKACRKGSK